ncbi:hypothetical protein BVY04_01160 [bacterium M21]|nr:hypothetical protein BVY04_01160 [bacterium M21]
MFNQIWILWALPLILLPVVIHLLNRLRYRTVRWAAMEFLLKAARHSTRRAKLREFLILACRVLVVLFLLLALSRPRVGGWLGLALSTPPETILLLLDRSASMEETIQGTGKTKRSTALQLIQAAAMQNGQNTRLVLIENSRCYPTEVNPEQLHEIPQTTPTDTAADIPRMMEAALFYLLENQTGKTEIWIASDMQKSNWRPDDGKWSALLEQFRNVNRKRPLRIRLLASPGTPGQNISIELNKAVRSHTLESTTINLSATISRTATAGKQFPLQILQPELPPSQIDLSCEGSELSVRHQLPLSETAPAGWGQLLLPQDDNLRDNIAWFTYDQQRPQQTALFVEDKTVGTYLTIAAAPGGVDLGQQAELFALSEAAKLDLTPFALVILQGKCKTPETRTQLKRYVDKGGILLCFPPADGPSGLGDLLSWKPIETATETGFHISHWEVDQGPLANSAEGDRIPVDQLRVQRRRQPLIEGSVIAEFKDGSPCLIRRQIGQGALYAFAILPRPNWSNLADGITLLPALQRMQQEGLARLSNARSVNCGAFTPGDQEVWESVDSKIGKDIQIQAGVYRNGNQLLAVNRPAAEHTLETVPTEDLPNLFSGLSFHLFIDTEADTNQAGPSEAWRTCLLFLLGALVLEAFLTLPGRFHGGHHDVD